MEVVNLKIIGGWNRVAKAARRTIGKEDDKTVSESWKAKMLLSGHSPLRLFEFDWTWKDIKQWVTVHLVRHHVGCEKFVHSQREDHRNLNKDYSVSSRDELSQGSLTDMDMTANVQSLINISRQRLCSTASKETREAWQAVKDEVAKVEPIIADKMVRECVYRGFCPQFKCCGYCNTEAFRKELEQYRRTDY